MDLILFIVGIILIFGGLVSIKLFESAIVPIIVAFIGVVLLVLSFTYSQSQGEAKVITNAGGGFARADVTSGWGTKAPWQGVVTWDLLSQQATYAGNAEGAPSYTGGNVQGQEITVPLNGTQAFVDIQVIYSQEADEAVLEALYREFRSQERFTQQRINAGILSTVREVPSNIVPDEADEFVPEGEQTNARPTGLSPVQFRGPYRDEVTAGITEALTERFEPFGITGIQVDLQDIRFLSGVEESLARVEEAQQRETQAQADLRAVRVEAQQKVEQAKADADAAREKAAGEADANREVAASLTPEILRLKELEAMGEGSVFVVPNGSQPLVSVNP